MIVKTGANYQEEGGYIEFAEGASTAIINGTAIPSEVYETSTQISSIVPALISKTADAPQFQVLVVAKTPPASDNKPLNNYTYIAPTTTPKECNLQTGFGANVAGGTPVLAPGSQDVALVTANNVYYLRVTGENPIAILGVA